MWMTNVSTCTLIINAAATETGGGLGPGVHSKSDQILHQLIDSTTLHYTETNLIHHPAIMLCPVAGTYGAVGGTGQDHHHLFHVWQDH
jgi:hypothetical protein